MVIKVFRNQIFLFILVFITIVNFELVWSYRTCTSKRFWVFIPTKQNNFTIILLQKLDMLIFVKFFVLINPTTVKIQEYGVRVKQCVNLKVYEDEAINKRGYILNFTFLTQKDYVFPWYNCRKIFSLAWMLLTPRYRGVYLINDI